MPQYTHQANITPPALLHLPPILNLNYWLLRVGGIYCAAVLLGVSYWTCKWSEEAGGAMKQYSWPGNLHLWIENGMDSVTGDMIAAASITVISDGEFNVCGPQWRSAL